jgi:hypothetical protein
VEPNKVFCSDTQADDLLAALSTANMLTPNWHTWHTNIHGSDIQDAPALACSKAMQRLAKKYYTPKKRNGNTTVQAFHAARRLVRNHKATGITQYRREK